MTESPRRWSGTELSRELDDVLSSANGDDSEQAIERVRARLSDALGPAFEISHVPPSAAPAHPVTSALRLLSPGKWLGLGALFVLGFGAFWFQDSGKSRGPAVATQASQDTRELGDPTVVAAPIAAGQAPEAPEAAGQAPVAAGQAPVAAGQAPEAPEAAGQAPVAAGQAPKAPVAAVQAPEANEPALQPRAASPSKRPVARAKTQDLGLAEELRQLNQIRQELHAAPARALIEADTHARRFPHGTLGPERELLRVDALLRLGREAEARKLAERMLAAPDGHPYRAQIEKLLPRP